MNIKERLAVRPESSNKKLIALGSIAAIGIGAFIMSRWNAITKSVGDFFDNRAINKEATEAFTLNEVKQMLEDAESNMLDLSTEIHTKTMEIAIIEADESSQNLYGEYVFNNIVNMLSSSVYRIYRALDCHKTLLFTAPYLWDGKNNCTKEHTFEPPRDYYWAHCVGGLVDFCDYLALDTGLRIFMPQFETLYNWGSDDQDPSYYKWQLKYMPQAAIAEFDIHLRKQAIAIEDFEYKCFLGGLFFNPMMRSDPLGYPSYIPLTKIPGLSVFGNIGGVVFLNKLLISLNRIMDSRKDENQGLVQLMRYIGDNIKFDNQYPNVMDSDRFKNFLEDQRGVTCHLPGEYNSVGRNLSGFYKMDIKAVGLVDEKPGQECSIISSTYEYHESIGAAISNAICQALVSTVDLLKEEGMFYAKDANATIEHIRLNFSTYVKQAALISFLRTLQSTWYVGAYSVSTWYVQDGNELAYKTNRIVESEIRNRANFSEMTNRIEQEHLFHTQSYGSLLQSSQPKVDIIDY